jgi:hypothetical protein
VPAFDGKRLGDPNRLGHPVDPHFEAEIDLGGFGQPFYRRGRAVMRGRAERDMPLACEHSRCRIHRHPARTREICLGPGVQIDHVLRNALRPLDRLDIGDQLDRIAGDEPRGETEAAEQLHQQPGAIPARPAADLQRFFGLLHAAFHADDITDPLLDVAVDIDQIIDGPPAKALMAGDQRFEQRPLRFAIEIGREIAR